jgi:hypothetical protein
MNRKKLKGIQLLLLLTCIAVFASSCFWYGPGYYGPRRHWHPRYYDGGGWHEGYYYR